MGGEKVHIRKFIRKTIVECLNENSGLKFYEYEELERTIRELGLGESNYKKLKEDFINASPVKLKLSIWQQLENTDYDVNSPDDVKERLIQYDRSPENYDKILDEIKKGKWYPPLILKINNAYYLVAGNTRLMVAKVNNIIPIVKIIEFKK